MATRGALRTGRADVEHVAQPSELVDVGRQHDARCVGALQQIGVALNEKEAIAVQHDGQGARQRGAHLRCGVRRAEWGGAARGAHHALRRPEHCLVPPKARADNQRVQPRQPGAHLLHAASQRRLALLRRLRGQLLAVV